MAPRSFIYCLDFRRKKSWNFLNLRVNLNLIMIYFWKVRNLKFKKIIINFVILWFQASHKKPSPPVNNNNNNGSKDSSQMTNGSGGSSGGSGEGGNNSPVTTNGNGNNNLSNSTTVANYNNAAGKTTTTQDSDISWPLTPEGKLKSFDNFNKSQWVNYFLIAHFCQEPSHK